MDIFALEEIFKVIVDQALLKSDERPSGVSSQKSSLKSPRSEQTNDAHRSSKISQSDRLTIVMEVLRSPGEFGSKSSMPCSHIKTVLSTISGRRTSAGRDSHRFHDRTNCAGTIAQGMFSKSNVPPVSALSCICFNLAWSKIVVNSHLHQRSLILCTFSSSAFLRISRLSPLEIWNNVSQMAQASASVESVCHNGNKFCNR